MINKLSINNFKSIKSLELECKRINIFVGKPNTGKSNILEALGLLSFMNYASQAELHSFVRFKRINNLFFDEALDQKIKIQFDNYILDFSFQNRSFLGLVTDIRDNNKGVLEQISGDYNGLQTMQNSQVTAFIKYYKFIQLDTFDMPDSSFLLPPSGRNLLSLLLSNRELRGVINNIFTPYGLRLVLKPQENQIEIQKQLDDVVIAYPYFLISDTLQRMVFYLCAVLSNKDSTLVFEEPESFAFPYYVKYLAETLALDENRNQYFISTHNPYFLLPAIEKAKKNDVAIFIVDYKDYQTIVRPLAQKEIAEIAEIDIFSNIDRYLEEK